MSEHQLLYLLYYYLLYYIYIFKPIIPEGTIDQQLEIVITFEHTVARLKYSLELVKTLFGSMASASE